MNDQEEEKRFGLKRNLDLKAGVSLIMGTMIGSGIFVSTKSVLESSGSPGVCLLMWTVCGATALMGALCYAELATLVPESGGELAYIHNGFKPLNFHLARVLSFLFSCPIALSIASRACSIYALNLVLDKCSLNEMSIKAGALLTLTLVALINASSVRMTERVIVSLTLAKLVALMVIIIGGLTRIVIGQSRIDASRLFENTNSNPFSIATGFYSGMWAYDGWNNLNFATEELIDASKNLPLSIMISVPFVTVVYALVNLSYFVVLDEHELMHSDISVAMSWSNAVLGSYFKWLLPAAIALSTFCTATCVMFSTSRINYASARKGFLMRFLTMINVDRDTPQPSVAFTYILSVVYSTAVSDLANLIDMFSFTTWIFYSLSIISLLILKFNRPKDVHSFSVHYSIAGLFLIVALYFSLASVIENPRGEYLVSSSILLLGIGVYYLFVHRKYTPPFTNKLVVFVQCVLNVALPNDQRA